jgi:hypothetical protein
MIYCVVPRELAETLYPRLLDHYKDDDNVRVIIERRHFDRRGRNGSTDGFEKEQRIIRDRRRARVAGDMLPLAHG